VQNDDSLHPEWTAIVMKKNRCPPDSNGCGAGEPHFDIAVPGFDNLQYSTANICGQRPGSGFDNKQQSALLGDWWAHGCSNTAECIDRCDQLPTQFVSGCRLFASWGWKRGDPTNVKYKPVMCPDQFVEHVATLFGPDGPNSSPLPAPTPAPTQAPTVSPGCARFCGFTNLRSSSDWCYKHNGAEQACLRSYVRSSNSGPITPCTYVSNKCKSDNANKVHGCPDLADACSTPLI